MQFRHVLWPISITQCNTLHVITLKFSVLKSIVGMAEVHYEIVCGSVWFVTPVQPQLRIFATLPSAPMIMSQAQRVSITDKD